MTPIHALVYMGLVLHTLCDSPADQDYRRGMAFAVREQWQSATKSFSEGWEKAPADKRFPIELAGVRFRLNDHDGARKLLHRALRIDPFDAYANDFLATLYLLDGNLEAALKYWNRLNKPHIDRILWNPQPDIDPVVLDQAFEVSRAEVLDYDQFLTTQARLNQLNVFGRLHAELTPSADDHFDLVLHSFERKGIDWKENRVQSAVRMFRRLPNETLMLEYFNIRRSATNSISLVRWDPQKRRAFTSFSGPVPRTAHLQYQWFLDLRNEDWNLSNFTNPAQALPQDLNLGTVETGLELRSVPGSSWKWQQGIRFKHRNTADTGAVTLFPPGYSFQYTAGMEHPLLRIPEHRWQVISFLELDVGKTFAENLMYSKLQADLRSEWFPLAETEDYAVITRFRAGTAFGSLPVDESYSLGMDRDSDLWLRAHPEPEKRGQNPIAKGYILLNAEINKILYRHPVFQFGLALFMDTAKTFSTAAGPDSRDWYWDIGLQWKIQMLDSASFAFTCGKNLRTGGNSFYFGVTL